MRFTKGDVDRLMEEKIKYKLSDKNYDIPLKELLFFYDVTNNLTNDEIFRSPSRIESLIPALANIEEAQRAKNINLKMSAKFILSNESQMQGTQEHLQPEEKQEIEGNFYQKDIIATTGSVRTQALANNFRQLLYDDNIASDSTKVFTAFGINRDFVSYWSQGQTTYDNKTTGELAFLQNTVIPSAKDNANTFTNHFGYKEQGKQIAFKFDHLEVMQEVEKQKMDMLKNRVDMLKTLTEAGATFESAAELVNLDQLKPGTQNGMGE